MLSEQGYKEVTLLGAFEILKYNFNQLLGIFFFKKKLYIKKPKSFNRIFMK